MGAFYTNVTVGHTDVDAVIAVLENLRRDAFVTPAYNGAIVVFDAHIESQDAKDIDRLASPISRHLRSAALLALNHDDDLLYRLLHATKYTIETERHAALVQLLGLPPAAVGSGYDTISDGELPEGVVESELRVVGAAAVRRTGPLRTTPQPWKARLCRPD